MQQLDELWRLKKHVLSFILSLIVDDAGFTGSNGILEFALIYDEINQLLLVNVLRARVIQMMMMMVMIYDDDDDDGDDI